MTFWVAGAALAGAVVSTAVNSRNTKKAISSQEAAAERANETTLTAQREAQDFEQKQIDQARADREPWRLVGANKLAELSERTGAGGDLMRNFSMSDFTTDPGYAFRQAEGQKAVTNSAAARGGLLSGAAAKAIADYGQNLASAEYGNAFNRYTTNQTNQFNRLASLADVGQVAANQNANGAEQFGSSVGNALIRTADGVANNQVGVGNARASGYLAQGNNIAGAINQGVSAWNQYQSNPPVAGATSPAAGPAGTYFDGYGYVPVGS